MRKIVKRQLTNSSILRRQLNKHTIYKSLFPDRLRGKARVIRNTKGFFMAKHFKLSRSLNTVCLTFFVAVGLSLVQSGWLSAWELGPAPTQTDRRITNMVTRYLRTEHVLKHPLDDDISERAMKLYLKTLDPIKSYYASVTRQDENGNPPGGFDPDQKMTRAEALRSYTRAAAYGAFQEKTNGSIETGKRADLTVLSKDILTVPDREILRAEVLFTIVDGQVRYRKP